MSDEGIAAVIIELVTSNEAIATGDGAAALQNLRIILLMTEELRTIQNIKRANSPKI